MAKPRTLFDKIWDSHVVERQDGWHLRPLYRPPSGARGDQPAGLRRPATAGRKVRRPDATLAVADHNVPTDRPQQGHRRSRKPRIQVETLEQNARDFGVPFYAHGRHPPGHRPRHRAGAGPHPAGHDHRLRRQPHRDAWRLRRAGLRHRHVRSRACAGDPDAAAAAPAKNMRVTVEGDLPVGVTAKDLILAIIGKIGTAGGTGYVIEYAGEAIRDASMEGRMTVCNMSIEAGARAGLIAPDETTFDYLQGRPTRPRARPGSRPSPTGGRCRRDAGAHYDKEVVARRPRTSRRRSPGAPAPRTCCRSPAAVPDPGRRRRRGATPRASQRALEYMGLTPGTPMQRRDGRQGLHRLLHQRPDRGPARGRRGRQGPQGRRRRPGDGRAGLAAWSSSRPRTKASTGSSRKPASNGASPAARCASA